MHLRLAFFVTVNGVEIFGGLAWETTSTVTGERHSPGATEDTFIGSHPVHAEAVRDRENFFGDAAFGWPHPFGPNAEDRKSTRLNSSHLGISYAVFCLK